MGSETYKNNQKLVESQRQFEYRVFNEVTQDMSKAFECEDKKELQEAIYRNSMLWSAIFSESNNDKSLPAEFSKSVIELALWVESYSEKVLQDAYNVKPLIDVNKTIMEGLIVPVQPMSKPKESTQLH